MSRIAVCDFDHSVPTPARTRTIVIDGRPHEIDVCPDCSVDLDVMISELLKNARTVPKPESSRRTTESRRRTAEIRAWWAGHPRVSKTPWQHDGRLPTEVIKAWDNR